MRFILDIMNTFLLNFNEIKNTKKLYNSELKEWKNFILPNIRNPYFRNPNLYVKDQILESMSMIDFLSLINI